VKLGLQLGYWGAQPNPFAVSLAQEAERLGFDSVWTAEAWGSDAFTSLSWVGAPTETIRLLGVDTPETHHPTKPVQCYGPEAAAYTASRLFGQVVWLEDDVERHDIYGRRLAYLYLNGVNFERELLRKGYARLLVIEPNHAHAREMLDDELNARARRVGLWSACGDAS